MALTLTRGKHSPRVPGSRLTTGGRTVFPSERTGTMTEIRTNHVPRFTLDAYELSADERERFDYLDWSAIDRGEDSATFVRYLGDLMDVGEFMAPTGNQFGDYWHGYAADTFFSATLIHLCDDGESVVMGRAYS